MSCSFSTECPGLKWISVPVFNEPSAIASAPLGDGVIDHQFLSMCDTAESRTCPRMSYLRPERMQQCAQYRGYVRYELPSLSPPELPSLSPPHTPTFKRNEETPSRTTTEGFHLRKQGDLNPRRCDPRWFSRPVHSTTLPHFRRQISFAFYRSNEKKSTGIACSGKSGKNVLSARLDAPKRACRRDWACPRALRADSLRT